MEDTMLVEFSVENFSSIKDKITFSLEATTDNSLPQNCISVDIPKSTKEKQSLKLLNSAAIFGANASGKTTVLRAMGILRTIIYSSNNYQLGQGFPIYPFLLDQNCLEKPSTFSVLFIKNSIKYWYELSITPTKVVSESLFYYPNGKKVQVFKRGIDNNISFMPINEKKSDEDEIRRKIYLEEISENILVLSLANKIKIKPLQDAFSWFYELTAIKNDIYPNETSRRIHENTVSKERVLKYLKLADSSIEDLELDVKEIEENNLPKYIKKMVIEELAKEKNMSPAELESDFNKKARIVKTEIKENFIHIGKDKSGNSVRIALPKFLESDGTQKLYGIISSIILSIVNGSVLFVDELDLRLHTNLVRTIVQIYSSELNKKGAQLIFTAHDTNLLDTQMLLRRDQIWFTEKQSDCRTELYCLSEFKIRKDKVIRKSYLAGIFGAIPNVTLEDILWQENL